MVIKRRNEYVSLLRDYQILLDGKRVGSIKNKEHKEFDIPSGEHTLKFTIDWTSSKTIHFSVGEADAKEFIIGSHLMYHKLFSILHYITVVFVVASIILPYDYLILFAVPDFLLIVYFATIGRKRALVVREQKRELNTPALL